MTALLKSMPRPQQKAGKYLVGFFAAVLALTLLSRGLDSYTIPVVTVQVPSSGVIGRRIEVQGTLEALSQSAVSAPEGFMVESVLVEEGSRVEAGEVIAVLDLAAVEERLTVARRELEIAKLNAASAGLYTESESADPVEAAQTDLERAQEDLERARAEGETAVGRAGADLFEARYERRRLRKQEADDDELSTAKEKVERLERELEDAQADAEKEELTARRALEDARRALKDAELSRSGSDSSQAMERQRVAIDSRIHQLEMESQTNEVAKLEKLLEDGGNITAPAAGIVTKLSIEPGEVTGSGGILLLSDISQGVLFKGTAEDEVGKRLARGDTGTLKASGETAQAQITALKAPEEKGNGYDVSAHLPDVELESGLSATFTVEQRSQIYNQVVPVSALHMRNGSTEIGHIYVLRERNTTLGTQLVAEEVAVQVLERNSTLAAVQAALEPGDRVITGSSRTVSAGDRVRVESGDE